MSIRRGQDSTSLPRKELGAINRIRRLLDHQRIVMITDIQGPLLLLLWTTSIIIINNSSHISHTVPIIPTLTLISISLPAMDRRLLQWISDHSDLDWEVD